MAFGLYMYELLKHNHLQLQLRISHQWFTRKTLLNTLHLYFMGRVILIDNPMSRVLVVTSACSLAIFACQMKIYLYTPIPILANMIWPCCLRLNA